MVSRYEEGSSGKDSRLPEQMRGSIDELQKTLIAIIQNKFPRLRSRNVEQYLSVPVTDEQTAKFLDIVFQHGWAPGMLFSSFDDVYQASHVERRYPAMTEGYERSITDLGSHAIVLSERLSEYFESDRSGIRDDRVQYGALVLRGGCLQQWAGQDPKEIQRCIFGDFLSNAGSVLFRLGISENDPAVRKFVFASGLRSDWVNWMYENNITASKIETDPAMIEQLQIVKDGVVDEISKGERNKFEAIVGEIFQFDRIPSLLPERHRRRG